MFEEIGYKIDKNYIDEKKEPSMWTTQDHAYIEYFDEKIINGTYYSMFIQFMVENKLIQVGGFEKGESPNGVKYRRVRNPILNMKEIKAINKKCKELGWL